MIDLQNHFTGTYGKNLLAQWSILSDLMHQQTIWVKETIQTQDQDSRGATLLHDRQINDALNGPFQAFFKQHLNAYRKISTIETALTLSKEDFFKESEPAVDITLGVPEEILSTMELSTLKELRDQLDDMTHAHFEEWFMHIQTWIETLLAVFSENKLTLSDLEIQDFSINQPLSELRDRFINLKIAIPPLSKSAFNFQQYFTLKITLAIQSALSRMQNPNTDKDIELALKSFLPALKTINESENELFDTQKKSVDQLIQP